MKKAACRISQGIHNKQREEEMSIIYQIYQIQHGKGIHLPDTAHLCAACVTAAPDLNLQTDRLALPTALRAPCLHRTT